MQPNRHDSTDAMEISSVAHDALGASRGRAEDLLTEVDKFLRRIQKAEQQFDLVADEVFIFLALGQLGLSVSAFGVTMRPVKCIEVADRLKLPKETARRKLVRITDRGYATMTKRGVMINDLDTWLRIATSVTP